MGWVKGTTANLTKASFFVNLCSITGMVLPLPDLSDWLSESFTSLGLSLQRCQSLLCELFTQTVTVVNLWTNTNRIGDFGGVTKQTQNHQISTKLSHWLSFQLSSSVLCLRPGKLFLFWELFLCLLDDFCEAWRKKTAFLSLDVMRLISLNFSQKRNTANLNFCFLEVKKMAYLQIWSSTLYEEKHFTKYFQFTACFESQCISSMIIRTIW